MLDVAYDVLKGRDNLLPAERYMNFADLYGEVATVLEMSQEEKDERIGAFYSGLSFDGRFVELTNNTWDLRANHTYEKVHIDASDVYSEEAEEAESDPEELDEEEQEERENEGEEGAPVPDDLGSIINKDSLYS